MGEKATFHPVPVVTLDGHSGSGKSTLARLLAERLQWSWLDSGAWYRAVSWATLEAGADPAQADSVLAVLSQMNLQAGAHGSVLVNDRDPALVLRTPAVDRAVSDVADHLTVREALNQRMRAMVDAPHVQGVVADGRDAGTVIFPNASLKVFVQADPEIRLRRRLAQYHSAGLEADENQIRKSMQSRDLRDAARGDSAPQALPGFVILDTNVLNVEQAVGRLLQLCESLSSPRENSSADDPTSSPKP